MGEEEGLVPAEMLRVKKAGHMTADPEELAKGVMGHGLERKGSWRRLSTAPLVQKERLASVTRAGSALAVIKRLVPRMGAR